MPPKHPTEGAQAFEAPRGRDIGDPQVSQLGAGQVPGAPLQSPLQNAVAGRPAFCAEDLVDVALAAMESRRDHLDGQVRIAQMVGDVRLDSGSQNSRRDPGRRACCDLDESPAGQLERKACEIVA